MPILERIISGRQTGADQAGWRVAKALGVPTGGWMPLGFLTEDGPRTEFAEMYGAQEMPTADYAKRTFQNARESHATLWFVRMSTPGAKTTFGACRNMSKEVVWVLPDGYRTRAVISVASSEVSSRFKSAFLQAM